MKKVMTVFGTRPEAIKMGPLVKQLESCGNLESVVCVTGQHEEMLNAVLKVFDITPDYNLKIMQQNQDLFDITNSILNKIKDVLLKEKPDLVLVHGDTSTTFVTALACFYLQIPVGHVEAGLRTYDLANPFPEEFNRQAVGIISQLNFVPTEMAKENLLSEKKDSKSIFVTGNTVIDAFNFTVNSDYSHPDLDWANDSKLILLTAHRRENRGKPMCNMFSAVKRVVQENPEVKVIFPVHMNPEIRSIATEYFANEERIRIIDPLDVVDFHNFEANSYLILTDSGGIQEEAPSFGVPVLVMRETTERPEGVKAGTLKLVGTSEENIYKEFTQLLTDQKAYESMSKKANPYGDGYASDRIVEIVNNYLYNSSK